MPFATDTLVYPLAMAPWVQSDKGRKTSSMIKHSGHVPIPLSTHQSPRTYLRATSPVPSRTVGMQANNRPTWTSPGGTWGFPTGYVYSDYSPSAEKRGKREGKAQRQCIVSMAPLLPAELSLFCTCVGVAKTRPGLAWSCVQVEGVAGPLFRSGMSYQP
jgi:hypothetical protein